MHGRKKKDQAVLSHEEEAENRQKVRKGTALMKQLLEDRAAKVYDEAALEKTMKALEFNPEYATFWNFRREILLHFMSAGADRKKLLDKELIFLERALSKVTKAYSVWLHRRWTLEQRCALEEDPTALLERELGLVEELFQLDARNFHAWNHRQGVVALLPDAAKRDDMLSETLITKNFSNYSAWHLRAMVPRTDIDAELEWVWNAIYTEPNDQSIWQYYAKLTGPPAADAVARVCQSGPHLYVVLRDLRPLDEVVIIGPSGRVAAEPCEGPLPRTSRVWRAEWPEVAAATLRVEAGESVSHKPVDSGPVATSRAVAAAQIPRLEELLELEPACKYAWLALAQAAEGSRDLREVWDILRGLDPLRAGFYEHQERLQQQRSRIASVLDWAGIGLTSFCPDALAAAVGAHTCNVADNKLSARALRDLRMVATLRDVTLDRNGLTGDVASLLWGGLNRLSLVGNSLTAWTSSVSSLRLVDVSGNPLPKRCAGAEQLAAVGGTVIGTVVEHVPATSASARARLAELEDGTLIVAYLKKHGAR